jgi:hypothetical protein
MRFRRKPEPPPLPMSPCDLLVVGLDVIGAQERRIEDMITRLHGAITCLDDSGLNADAARFRAQQLITALRVVQAL